ncbi:diguanylate cyclase [Cohnella xylanilytica]|uniref:Diguanylate cyclase n=1 Tax=Cohnella xylanilytica TaxID=557555 RepID=A0A841TUC4_9BACL|nr:histidine kinase N-terminal 7TM domain-containing protein [Cohnella xylanilytica]MBB6691279.1 diguanylate cyclase [Cohnella xylanilytica]
MGSPNSPYIAIAALAGVLNILLAIYAGVKRSDFPGVRTFLWIAAASAVYALGYSFELAGDSLEEIKFWVNVEYAGMPFIPPLCLILALHYVGVGKLLSRKAAALLFLVPILTLLAVTTNDEYHFFYVSMYLREDAPAPLVDLEIGQWYIVHGVYTVACLLGASFLLIRHWKKTKKAYRKQLLAFLFSLLLPFAAAFLYLMGATPSGMDPVPPLTCATSLAMAWSIFRNDVLTVVPVARDTIFDSMRDGALVLDMADRLVDYNRAAAEMIPSLAASTIGMPIGRIWQSEKGTEFPLPRRSPEEERASRTEQAEEPAEPLERQLERQLEWPGPNGVSYYLIRSSPIVRDNGKEAGRIIVLIDITEQRKLQEHLRRLAYFDGLTNIYNRTHFIQLGKQRLEEALTEGRPLSLILFDIDHFKSINDTYGHETGDDAIRHVVEVCRSRLGPEALFGRYGGEEFVVCLPSEGIGEAAALAERLRRAVAASPLETADAAIPVTASFGVAEATPAAGTIKALLREADLALYRSKASGRNAVSLAEPLGRAAGAGT